jgi:hypothetical protein
MKGTGYEVNCYGLTPVVSNKVFNEKANTSNYSVSIVVISTVYLYP